MPSVTLVSKDIPGRAPGTNLYAVEDGTYLTVEAMPVPEKTTHFIKKGDAPLVDNLLAQLGKTYAALKVVIRPTVILLADEHGNGIDSDLNDNDPMTPLHTFPAGTTHEKALAQAGYTVA